MDSLLSAIGLMLKMVIFVIVVVIVVGVFSYNKLQRSGQAVKSANATALTVIQKRADLINKLMDIAKDYGNHEKLIYISVSQNLMDTFKTSTTALANVNAMALNYPELKANVTYQNLMHQIHGVENELQQKRELYNQIAQMYNAYRLQIPTIFFSKLLGFMEAPYFDFDNLQEMREFNTDDGQLLREVLSNASAKAIDITQKGVSKVQEKIQQASGGSEQVIRKMAETHEPEQSTNNQQTKGKHCESCSTVNDNNSIFCLHCGKELSITSIEPDQKTCPSCSMINKATSSFCAACGTKL